jgi:hypothetical protein
MFMARALNQNALAMQSADLVGGALTQATRTWLPDLFRRTVAEPLQFGEEYLCGGALLRKP